MDFGINLKNIRLRAGLTQKELARLVHTTTAQISRWENGENTPSLESILLLIDALGSSANELLPQNNIVETVYSHDELDLIRKYKSLDHSGKEMVMTVCNLEYSRASKKPISNKKIRKIPLYYNPAAAGLSAPSSSDEFAWLDLDSESYPGADFAVRISGDSMSPIINDGEIVYIKKTSDIFIGDIGIFNVDGAVYCKQYFKDQYGNVTLVSYNKDYKNTNVYISNESGQVAYCNGIVMTPKKIDFPAYFFAYQERQLY